jgi:hypothetical protein
MGGSDDLTGGGEDCEKVAELKREVGKGGMSGISR